MYHPDVMLAGNLHHAFKKLQFDTLGGGIAREIQYQHFRLGPGILNGFLQFFEEGLFTPDNRHMADIGTGDHEPIRVYGISRVWNQHRVTRPNRCQGQMCQPFFGTDGHNRLCLRIKIHIITAFVPVADGLAQARNTLGQGVAMGIRSLCCLAQLIDNMLRRRSVRIAHTKIDNIFTTRSSSRLQLVDNIEDVGWQAFDSGKFVHEQALSAIV